MRQETTHMNKALKNLIRKHYIDLEGYVSAGMEAGKDKRNVFMNANENPFELPGLEGWNRYPEPQPPALLDAYAKAYDVRPEQIIMTRGADEAIVILTKLFCEPHEDGILICPPTFGMYQVDASAMPANVIEVPLIKQDGTFTLNENGMIAASDKAKMIFICSPNNPTGTSFDHDVIARIAKAVEGKSAIILDETYAEFSEQDSFTGRLGEHPNVIILRTLSKSYSMAGMRMGCFISGDTDFTALIRAKCLDAYPLPRASIAAALHVLSDEIRPLAMENIKTLLTERDRLREGFEASPLVRYIYPSDANFLLIEMERAKEFIDFCKAQNIILRDFSSKPMTEGCIRISPGLPEDNDKLLMLLNRFSEA